MTYTIYMVCQSAAKVLITCCVWFCLYQHFKY